MIKATSTHNQTRLIIGNSNKRFSGVTSTMLQLIPHQQALTSLAVLGEYHLPSSVDSMTYLELLRLCRVPLANGLPRVFHARRNDEMIQALIAKRIFGAKLSIAFTSTAQRHHSRFTRWLMSQMDAIISTCDAAASYIDCRPVDIIVPHGIDTSRYTPAQSRKKAWRALGLPGDIGIGIFGRVRHSKGIDILVDAVMPLLHQHQQVTIVVCGECIAKDRAYQTQLQESIEQAGLSQRFVFLGKQPFENLPGLFRAMTIVAALSREEGYGLTPLEAMASGSAVLTSEAGAWNDIIQSGKQGYRVKTGSVEAAREKLSTMLNDLPQTELMGTVAREYVMEHYTVEREARDLTQFLLSLAAA